MPLPETPAFSSMSPSQKCVTLLQLDGIGKVTEYRVWEGSWRGGSTYAAVGMSSMLGWDFSGVAIWESLTLPHAPIRSRMNSESGGSLWDHWHPT